jgi:hypothetical protein
LHGVNNIALSPRKLAGGASIVMPLSFLPGISFRVKNHKKVENIVVVQLVDLASQPLLIALNLVKSAALGAEHVRIIGT